MKFKELLEIKNISGYQLAKLTKIPQQQISRYVTEQRDILHAPFDTVIRICDALELSLDEFRKLLEE